MSGPEGAPGAPSARTPEITAANVVEPDDRSNPDCLANIVENRGADKTVRDSLRGRSRFGIDAPGLSIQQVGCMTCKGWADVTIKDKDSGITTPPEGAPGVRPLREECAERIALILSSPRVAVTDSLQ